MDSAKMSYGFIKNPKCCTFFSKLVEPKGNRNG